MTATYRRLADHNLDVTVVVRVASEDRFSHWSIRVDNRAGLAITDAQFPFVVTPYDLAGTPGAETLLWPYFAGVLIQDPQPQDLCPDCGDGRIRIRQPERKIYPCHQQPNHSKPPSSACATTPAPWIRTKTTA